MTSTTMTLLNCIRQIINPIIFCSFFLPYRLDREEFLVCKALAWLCVCVRTCNCAFKLCQLASLDCITFEKFVFATRLSSRESDSVRSNLKREGKQNYLSKAEPVLLLSYRAAYESSLEGARNLCSNFFLFYFRHNEHGGE
jgi:hypothetical protein